MNEIFFVCLGLSFMLLVAVFYPFWVEINNSNKEIDYSLFGGEPPCEIGYHIVDNQCVPSKYSKEEWTDNINKAKFK